ncbi:MAG TPA: DUF397 domain-containing protein [Actinophytocola sp.]|jgi:hypothetical protein|uniref:DUF397 domain-containing protein n=1 Tax=Actinophytocola sp. TaxID=1872138 RepID=UPI002E0A56CC|nr:DUF397 domain-containing protein [Actinophytocola sp.]
MTTLARPQWRISSYSSAGENCVEVAPVPDRVLVRDTKQREGSVIEFNRPVWTRFVSEVGHG